MKVMVSGRVDPPSIEGVQWVRVDPEVPLPAEVAAAEGMVLWNLNRPFIQRLVEAAPNLHFIQTLTAGVDHVLSLNLPEQVQLYRAPNLHEELVTEHALALLMASVRRLHVLRDQQKQALWKAPHPFGSIHSSHVVIWGYGNIGRNLARVLQALGARVTGVRTRAGSEDGVPVITRQQFPEVLPTADHLVMVLPSTPDTQQVLNREVLALLPAHAWVVNVGRGNAIEQNHLLAALQQGKLAGAALDVTDPEPLPADHPFWHMENVILTPHVGSQSDRLMGKMQDFLKENLGRLLLGEPLQGKVDRNRGY